MSNEDGSVWVTYNGELYNELEPPRRARAPRGTVYRTVVRHREPGPSLRGGRAPTSSRRLNGMFALAIWDAPPRPAGPGPRPDGAEAALSTPRLPGGGLAFGSEPKALLRHPDVARRLDPDSLARYLFYEYVPAPHSIWEGCGSCPRGHVLVWEDGRRSASPGTGSRRRRRPRPSAAPFEEAAERFWDDFRDAVGRHRRSDVPLGVFLSGGRRLVERRRGALRARAGRGTSGRSRSGSRTRASTRAATPAPSPGTWAPTTTSGPSRSRRCYELLPEVAAWLDEPFGDASILPTHLLSRFARERGRRSSSAATAPTSCWPATRRSRPSAPPGSSAACPGRPGRWPGRRSAGCRSTTATSASTSSSSSSSAAPPSRSPLAHQRWLGLVLGAGDRPAAGRRRARLDVEAEHLAPRRGAGPGRRPADPVAGALPGHVPARGHPDQGRPGEHGLRAGGPGAVPRRRAGRLDPAAARRRYKYGRGQTKRLLKRAAAGRLPAVDPEPAQEGVRHPGRPLAPRARWPRCSTACSAPTGSTRQGLFRPDEVARRIGEHRAGRPRPPQAALDAPDVPALVRSLAAD